ncbi:MAG: helix-turn-helix domain-containing protein [bacterium]|nr:helix-turn-helix domain-containing protein [bacterium]
MLEELKKIGLSENEAKVYLVLLEIGSATADEIAKKAGVKRPTTYVQLEDLMNKGLVSSFEKIVKKGGAEKTFFRAEDPDHLQKLVETENKKAKERMLVLEKSLPELGRLFQFAGSRPKVRFFEGKEGLQTMQDEAFKMKDKHIISIVDFDGIIKIFPDHPEKHTPIRVQKGIQSKVIYTSVNGDILGRENKAMLRETRFISPDQFPFTCDLAIYDHILSISALREKSVGVLIEDKDISNSMRALFKLLWEKLS